MTVNYVLSFCKITAASKIFSRNFYLPLLKPVTPKEALRTLRITGKWLLGAKIQHYIPALLNHVKHRPNTLADYGKVPHEFRHDYKYVSAVIDPENESHRVLLNILNTKSEDGVFVYTIDDIKCNLVITAPLEYAIRHGDVIDVMISQRSDKVILKLNDSRKIPLETSLYSGPKKMCKGEGATTEEEEKNHHHGQWTMSLAKIFEDKERQSEEWEKELQRIILTRKKQAGEGTIEWEEMVKENINKLDWRKFEKEAKKVIEQISDPVAERHIEMEVEDLELTRYANETLEVNGLNQLPTMKEISDVVRNLTSATFHQIEAEIEQPKMRRRISGVKVTLSSGKECFITGQMVHTEDGEVFVPGQTVENEFGIEYAPGITIIMDNKPTLISGLIMGEEEREPMFLPTQSTVTADGQLTFTTEAEARPNPPPARKEKHKFQNSFVKNDDEVIKPEPEVAAVEEVPKKVKKRRKKTQKKKQAIQEEPEVIKLEETPVVQLDIVEELTERIKTEEEIKAEEEKRLELERLMQRLEDDGMDDVIASLESKKLKLKKKLEEMRKLCVNLENDAINYASTEDAMEIAQNIVDNKNAIPKIADILLTITRRVSTFRDKHSIKIENVNGPFTSYNSVFATDADEKLESASQKLQILLKKSIVSANDVFKTRPKDQLLALHTLGDIIGDALRGNELLIEELCRLMNTTLERNEVCTSIFRQLTQDVKEDKVESLKSAIKSYNNEESYSDVLEKLELVLQDKNCVLGEAFTKLGKNNHTILQEVVNKLRDSIDDICTENSAAELVQNVIVNTVKKFAHLRLAEIMETKEEVKRNEFLAEALAFSRILEVQEAIERLSTNHLLLSNCDKSVLEFLQRQALITQLTDKDYYLKAALERIKKNPDCGKTDPRIRQLVRQSAALFYHPTTLRNSRDIPLRLMRSQNPLVIEDFLIRKDIVTIPVLVSRQGLQIVIPKEASRSVLAGRVPYVTVDEQGVTNYKPIHLLNAVKLAPTTNGRRYLEDHSLMDEKLTAKLHGQVRKLNRKLLGCHRRLA